MSSTETLGAYSDTEPLADVESLQLASAVERTVYPAKEHVPLDIPLADLMIDGQLDIYPEVRGKNYFNLILKQHHLAFQAGGFVGLIPINDRIAIDVHPRVPIKNLAKILSLADHQVVSLAPHTRLYMSDSEASPSIVQHLALALLDAVDQVSLHGLHKSYHHLTADTSFPHGRIQLGETMRHFAAMGNPYRVTASWFDRSMDTEPNRCLKYAIWHLARRYRGINPQRDVKRMVSRLNSAYHLFASVTLDQSRRFLGHPLVRDPNLLPSNWAHYRQPLYLADTITRDRGVRLDQSGDTIEMASLAINLADVFESYIRVALRTRLEAQVPSILVLNGNVGGERGGRKSLFDPGYDEDIAGGKNPATPDVVLSWDMPVGSQTQYPVILDTKYKDVGATPDPKDVQQVIAYAASYRAPSAVLVSPRIDERHGLRSLGRITGTTHVYQYFFDLSADDLLVEEQSFAAAIRSLL